jgi:hypothetical protein
MGSLLEWRAVIGRPSALLYLAAVAVLPWVWIVPFPVAPQHAQWGDLLIALAAAAWLVEQGRGWRRVRFRAPHAAVLLYLAASGASLLVSPARHRGVLLLVGMAGLAVLFFLTSELTADAEVRAALTRVLVVTALLIGAAAAVGLVLHFAGRKTLLIGTYGELEESSRYARVQAGFYNSSLLASFCTFASAVVAGGRAHVSKRWRWAAQVVLLLVVVATFSRAIIGFLAAMAIRAGAGSRRGRVAATAACLAATAAVVFLTVASVTLDPSRPGSLSIGSEPSGRRQTAVASARTLGDHPWLGKGLGSFPGGWDGRAGQAHLTALEVAAVHGPVALVGLAGLVVVLWRRRSRPTDLATWSALAAMAIDSLAMDVHRFRHVWILLGMADAGRSKGTLSPPGHSTAGPRASVRGGLPTARSAPREAGRRRGSHR